MKFLLLLSLLIAGFHLPAQITLSRQVIGAAGVNSPTLSSNVGETAVSSYVSDNQRITEGFEQPANTPLLVEAEIVYQGCWNGANASIVITTATGCGGVSEILWNDTPGGLILDSLSAGMVLLNVVAAGGCQVPVMFDIATPNLPPCDLDFYDTVTPNGDGYNDAWVIGNITHPDYATNKVVVVNRWGQTVWQGSNYDNQTVVFKGLDANGSSLPEGAYYFEFKANGSSFTGVINLLQ
ncbi:MAG: hypothetical protein RL226_681 [Bacteroidota bacterium]